MTIDGFVRALKRKTRETGRKWVVAKGERLRTRNGRCPLEFVGGVHRPHDYSDAGERLGLSTKDVNTIIGAADNMDRNHAEERVLRRRLFRACGLKPEPTA